jgi:CO dehydrogenase/acetyl-CoA synthase gamma subunit (corrinoid Fe-S protein)
LAGADLYIENILFEKYLDQNACGQCGFSSCDAFIDAVRKGTNQPGECSFIKKNKTYAFDAVRKIEQLWPEVPLLTHPRPDFTGLIELNDPDDSSLVLISGNNEFTEQVLMTVLSTTICPFFVIFVNTEGNTVDMSMIYKTLTAARVARSLNESGIDRRVQKKELIIPGLASSLEKEVQELTGWNVRVGPVCAAELPLYLSEIWIPPE